MKIDENVIYKEVYESIKDIKDWCFKCDVSGKEVGTFINGVTTLATKLLKIVEEKNIKEEE